VSTTPAKPVIGLTTYKQRAQTGVWDTTAAYLPAQYFEAVQKAGGIPVLLPPQPVDDEIAGRVLDGLDGLIITGGGDIEATRYGAEPHEKADPPNRERDAFEDALLAAAIDRELPFLGICRGLQMLNVVRGGTLVQHLPDIVGDDRYNIGDGEFAVNEASVEPDTKLAELVGAGPIEGKSYHHQAVQELGDGLRATAHTADGTVYGLELADVPFGVAVQWHPEEDAAEDARLFAGLVEAARVYAERQP
jgi:putative glutamine amidotransferase